MVMPTQEQRVRFLVHHAWDLRDAGVEDAALVRQLVEQGVPQEIAESVPGLIDGAIPGLIHDDTEREAIVQRVEAAVEAEDFDGLREALLEGVDDDRTLHKMSITLSNLLVSDSRPKGTVAAFGLSFMVGIGDWPMIQALSHEDANVRFRAAFGLGKMGVAAHNAIQPLQQAANDPDEYVSGAARDALLAIQGTN